MLTWCLHEKSAERSEGGRSKKPSTITVDVGRIHRHLIPLIGTGRVKDLTKADINKVLKDIMAADTISGYIQRLLDGIEFKQTPYAPDRDSRRAALDRFLTKAAADPAKETEAEIPLAT